MRSVLSILVLMVWLGGLACDQGASSSDSKKEAAQTDSDKKADKKSDKKPDKKSDKKPDKKADTSDKKADDKADKKADDKKDEKAEAKTTDKKTTGRPFEGPPSEAIVGLWNIQINRDSLPDGIKNFEELDKALRGTMKFDGKIAVVNISGQADAVPYTVLRDKDETLELALAGESKAKFVVTFVDHDNIKLKDTQRSGELLGARQIDKADK